MAKQLTFQRGGFKSAVRKARTHGTSRRKSIVKKVQSISKGTRKNAEAIRVAAKSRGADIPVRTLQAKMLKAARAGKRRPLSEVKSRAKQSGQQGFVRALFLGATGR